METERNDRRINRTRRLLRDSLLSLILEKGYAAVTIEEITERADLGRTTFYLHYKDKEELLLESIEAIANELKTQIMNVLPLHYIPASFAEFDREAPRQAILLVFQHAANNADLYRIILSGQGASKAPIRIRDIIDYTTLDYFKERVLSAGFTPDPHVPLEIVATYFAGSLLSLLTWWLEKNMPYSAEEMADMFAKMFFRGSREILGVPLVDPNEPQN
ncbi:MAG: TetR/AcrR family transcriptional regulator [Anaerolineaceae bacterium]|nr:TetR/AcrR family transcriptional regulator [Anaerolineaceae bacterium]